MRNKANFWAAGSLIALQCGQVGAQTNAAAAAPAAPASAPAPEQLEAVTVTGSAIGKGEARANSVVDEATIQEQPAGLDPLKLINRVPGVQVSSSDALTGSFSCPCLCAG